MEVYLERLTKFISGYFEEQMYILELIFYKYLSEKIELNAENIAKKNNLLESFEVWDDLDSNVELVESSGYLIEKDYWVSSIIKNNNTYVDSKNLTDILDEAFKAFKENNLNEKYGGLFNFNYSLQASPLKRENLFEIIIKVIDSVYVEEGLTGLRDAFEFLLNKFSEQNGNRLIYSNTPKSISNLLMKLTTCNMNTVRSAYDPSYKSGSLLLEVVDEFKNVDIYGQEINIYNYEIAKMRSIMHEVSKFNLKLGNILESDEFSQEKFDIVLSNPPYGIKWSGEYKKQFEAFNYLAPKSKSEYAFVQHMLYHLKDTGVMAVVLPVGVLFRGGNEQKIREQLINEMNYLDGVIQLPANLFYETSIPVCILLFRKNRKKEQNILFIDASNEFEKEKNTNSLNNQHINKIVNAYKSKSSLNKFSRLVTVEEIKENEYNIGMARYIDSFEEDKHIDLENLEFEINETEKKIVNLENLIFNYYKAME